MIKRIIQLKTISFVLLAAGMITAFSTQLMGNNTRSIDTQIEYLIKQHTNYMNAKLQNASYDGFTRSFFTDAAFLEDRQAVRFLKQVKAQVNASRNYPGMQSMMSFTRMTAVNGDYRMIQYQFAADGNNIRLVRSTNNNGELLKSVFDYDISGKLLNVTDTSNQKIVEQKLYKI